MRGKRSVPTRIVLPGVILLPPDARARASDATYSYDAPDRLTREQGPAITQSFGYDANGNRLSDGVGSPRQQPPNQPPAGCGHA